MFGIITVVMIFFQPYNRHTDKPFRKTVKKNKHKMLQVELELENEHENFLMETEKNEAGTGPDEIRTKKRDEPRLL
ncbi:hypothetical protein RCO48_18225 [Peribacillus frigoritolerans]|nr:hypothetical protein [Peribacillus frigoritolerans]